MEGDRRIELFAHILERHGLQPKERAVIGDLADLSLSVGRLQEAILEVQMLAEEPPSRERLEILLGALAHEVSNMRMLCEDLEAPLDELSAGPAAAEAMIRAVLGTVTETLDSFSSSDPDTDEEDS